MAEGVEHYSLINGKAGMAGGAVSVVNGPWTPDEDMGTTVVITGPAAVMVVTTTNINQPGRFVHVFVENADAVNFVDWGGATDKMKAPGDYLVHYDGTNWHVAAMPHEPYVEDGTAWTGTPAVQIVRPMLFTPGNADLWKDDPAGTYEKVSCKITIDKATKTVTFEIGKNQAIFNYHLWISP